MGYFRFFLTHFRLFTALYPTLCVKKKKLQKILQITIYEKSKNFTVIVSQMRVLGQKNYWGGAPNPPPPPAFIGLTLEDGLQRFPSRHHHTILKNIYKDDIKIVTKFPCLFGHHVPFDIERVPAQWNLEISWFPDNSQGALSVTGEPELPNSTQLNTQD